MFELALTQFRNGDFSELLHFVQSDGAPVNFTGSTFLMQIRTSAGAPDPAALNLTSPSGGIAHTNLTQGQITITIARNALAVGGFVFDLVRVNGSAREVLAYGTYTVLAGVTQ